MVAARSASIHGPSLSTSEVVTMWSARAILVVAVAAPALVGPLPAPSHGAAAPAMPSDFNGDGYADLAIGVPGEGLGPTRRYAGAVNVLYGSPGGLTAAGDQFWSQASAGVKGVAEDNEWFGSALASGDFDRDGYADLAIGVWDRVAGFRGAGAVSVLYGSAAGLTADRDQRWTKEHLGAAVAAEEGFGDVLAAGDLNSDGYDDLAIGGPGEGASTGIARIMFGGPDGLIAQGALTLEAAQTIPGYDGGDGEVFYGAALAIADLDGNGRADLAIGVPGHDIGATFDAGAVNVLYGGVSGVGSAGTALWTRASPGVAGKPDYQDDFGAPLVAGDFDGDGYADLGIGVVGDMTGGHWVGGAVNVLYGSPTGLASTRNQLWHQDVPGVPGRSGEHQFGAALAASDLDGDGRSDLAIGAPWDTTSWVGSVTVLYGTASGLSTTGVQRWTQDSRGVPGASESTDQFGSALSIGDFDGSGVGDLAIGVPFESIHARQEAGRVVVIYGRAGGLSAGGAQSWSQRSAGVKGIAQAEDSFGSSLAP